ncbi:MAG TPA: protein kinase, partial [Polyangiaceae bacterium]|nr:protein kinase [Polyangiaceae bacterium]
MSSRSRSVAITRFRLRCRPATSSSSLRKGRSLTIMRLVTVMNGDDELQTAAVEATLDLPVQGDAPASPPAPTRMVGERFALVRKIGEGAFGLVYEAEDRVDGGRVALKMLRQLGPEWPDRFKREFRSLRDLDHPHVVQLFELFFLDGRWCFTMELLDGVHLVAHLRDPSRGEVVDPKRVRTAFAQLASALASLHALGKVHRDVKPSNVFVTRDGRVVLLDFGLVTDVAVRELTRSRIVGTPSYMAPEQATQGEVGPPADMYAMGAMLYEVLTGKPPFSGDARWVLLDKLSARPVPMPESGPKDLAALAVSLLQPSPEARPTAIAVLEQLAHGAPDDLERVPVSLLRPPSSPHFVGRQAELAALEGAFDLARGRAAVIASVHGPSGIGKTALVGRFVDRLRDEGAALVFSSRCYEREAVPFKAFDELADQLVRHLLTLPEGDGARVLASESSALQRMFPVFSIMQASLEDVEEPIDPREMRQQAFSAFAAILARLGAARPLVLWIDDAQWGDDDSAEILLSILPPAGPSSLLVALAHRLIDGAPGGFLHAMAARTPAAILRFDVVLEALTSEDVRALVSQTIDADPSAEDWAEVVARETEGNPFFVKELARFLRDRPASAADFARASSSHSLEDMILERVGRLPPGARRLLEVVALAG